MEPPSRDLPPPALSYEILDVFNLVLTGVFTFEFVVQVMDKGLVMHQGAYLRNSWNLTDSLVLGLSWIDISGLSQTRQARVLRLGRALRPLRLIKRNEGMRLIVDALLATWRPVSMIFLLALCVTTVFAIIGMAMFKGTFSRCTDVTVQWPRGRSDCSGLAWAMPMLVRGPGIDFDSMEGFDVSQAFAMPAVWDAPTENFDSFFRAFVSLLAVNTFNYGEMLVAASASTEKDIMPKHDHNAILAGIFFVVYTIASALFVMNLFVAFIIDGFNQLRQADAIERERKVVYKQFMKTVQQISPHRQPRMPHSRWRVWVREVVLPNRIYDNFFTLCVFFNITVLALFNDSMSEQFQEFYVVQNNVFFALMVVELLVAVCGLGWVRYLQDPWVYIDLLSILGAVVAFLVEESTFIRSFRLVRVLRIVNNVPALRRMLETLSMAVTQIGNVVLLMIVVFAMFAILCVNFLGNVREGTRLGSPTAPWPANPPNFSNFPVAMLLLFQIIQGDEWHQIMHDASVQPPFCTDQFPGVDYGDCGIDFGASVIMFVGFKIVAEFVLLNLFIGMILDAFMKAEDSSVEFHMTKAPIAQAKTSVRRVSKKKEGDRPGA
eukprot:CAMPEP_0206246660 /NCGR_PEP_ID=MMETSP0047_2-20121206/19385_1 /ASSEMBLY_ACC=CAM_ASM_000192 /TAXON_ID=195065 /ORGANISM="Chroomonas mesostigmatica_cf, Strain CCMP1168" /LENGTH=603 /DNA_ID=CAMNT_0053672113 /DNA_START=264 /DNA_END=2072 /DNA_ORIENTATION=+